MECGRKNGKGSRKAICQHLKDKRGECHRPDNGEPQEPPVHTRTQHIQTQTQTCQLYRVLQLVSRSRMAEALASCG